MSLPPEKKLRVRAMLNDLNGIWLNMDVLGRSLEIERQTDPADVLRRAMSFVCLAETELYVLLAGTESAE